MPLMLKTTPHCAVFLVVIVVGSAAAKTSPFFGAIIGEQMTLHANPEENRLGILLGKREKQPFYTYIHIHLYM